MNTDRITKITHTATQGVKAPNEKPKKLYVTAEILYAPARTATLIRSKHREEQQAKRLGKKRIFAVWREVAHCLAGHGRPTFVDLDTSGPFRSRIYHTPEGTNVYQRNRE